jgi:hypothetical protein
MVNAGGSPTKCGIARKSESARGALPRSACGPMAGIAGSEGVLASSSVLGRADGAGALAAMLLAGAVLAPAAGAQNPAWTLLLFAGSAVLLAAFALIESRHPAPLVPLRLLRSRTLAAANAAMLLVGATLTATGRPSERTLIATFVSGPDGSGPQFQLGERNRLEAIRTPHGWRLSHVESTPVWSVGSRPVSP